MYTQKKAPQQVRSMKVSRADSITATITQQAKPLTMADIERSLCPTEAHALELSQRAAGINDQGAALFGHLSFTARIWDLENKGYVFDKPEVDWIDSVGKLHKNVVFYKFIEWRADLIGCKDKAKVRKDEEKTLSAINLAKQLPLFDSEMD